MPGYRSALITGASRGLGAALADTLAARGLKLVLVARSESDLARVKQSVLRAHPTAEIITVVSDLGDRAQQRSLCERIERGELRADVLINNAGVGSYKPLLEWTPDEIAQCIEINTTAPMLLAKALLPQLIAQRGGYIINVASDLARRPLGNMAAYVASKHALLGFSHSLLRETKAHGIKVTAVLPGIIDSAFNGATEGSKDITWAMQPAELAQQIAALLDTPAHLVIDELTAHPMQQDF